MQLRPIKALKVFFGADLAKNVYPPDFESLHIDIFKKVTPYTMTSKERIFSLIEAVKYIVQNNIPGDIVECGVWKGGSMMTIAETLRCLNVTDRELYLYDTYEGMTAPTEHDLSMHDETAMSMLNKEVDHKEKSAVWAYSALEEVKANVGLVNYPDGRIHFIKGDVLKTIPNDHHQQIALLRLDTDWYESTAHELLHLYPKLVQKGVMIIDDYGCWKGARKAVDEYLGKETFKPLLNRIDETGRIIIKV